MICVGLDWAERHHDIVVLAETGELLAELRVGDTLAGVEQIHAVVAPHIAAPAEVVVGTESVHGLVVQALVAAGYTVYEINPKASSRYRDRHHLAGAKSDRDDAKLLADVVRTDRHNHRPYAGNSELAEAIKVLARAHQSLINQRQAHLNELRTTLRQDYPALLMAFPELAAPSARDCPDALALVERAPTPAHGKRLSQAQSAAALRTAGRQRDIDRRAGHIRQALHSPHLAEPALVTEAGKAAQASAQVIMALTQQIEALSQALNARFEDHPDATILRSLPGLGPLLGARLLGEFGDTPDRFANAKARKNYATTSPVTRASGKVRLVNARHSGNRQLANSCLRFAFSAIQASPGARRYYTALRRDKTHAQAIRSVANRLVGILHGCLKNRCVYDEAVAWPPVEAGT